MTEGSPLCGFRNVIHFVLRRGCLLRGKAHCFSLFYFDFPSEEDSASLQRSHTFFQTSTRRTRRPSQLLFSVRSRKSCLCKRECVLQFDARERKTKTSALPVRSHRHPLQYQTSTLVIRFASSSLVPHTQFAILMLFARVFFGSVFAMQSTVACFPQSMSARTPSQICRR